MNGLAVLLTGALAMAFVARVAMTYRGLDPIAFGLVLVIGTGLTAGVLEGLWRVLRACRLRRELRPIHLPVSREAVARTSPALRPILEARIGGTAVGPSPAAFAPYLLGMLVMVGLLGTFLGLFETLRGAREALATSTDMEALRRGLSAPMGGLSRAFGTSAAGVSASAMLGLGLVFVRRAEVGFGKALAAFVAGPLASLSVAQRQLAALETLVQQGSALPGATATLRDAFERLSDFESAIRAAQEKASAAATSALRAAAAEIRADIDRGIVGASEAIVTTAEPLLERAVERAAAAAALELNRVRERMEEDARQRTAREADHLARVAELLRGLARDFGTSRSEEAKRIVSELDRAAGAIAAVEARQAEADGTRARILGEAVTRIVTASEGSGRAMARIVESERRRLEEDAAAHEARYRKVDAMTARIAELTNQVAAASDAEAARLAELARTLREERSKGDAAAEKRIDRVLNATGERMDHLLQTAAERMDRVFHAQLEAESRSEDRLARLTAAQAEAESRTEQRVAKLLAARIEGELRTEERMAQVVAARLEGEATSGTRLMQVAGEVDRLMTAQAERFGAFERALHGARAEGMAGLADQFRSHLMTLAERLGETAELVAGATSAVAAGGAEMGAVAEMFLAAVDRYRDASDRWLANLGAIEDAIDQRDAAETTDILGAYLAQTREVFDSHLQFQRELFTELRALRERESRP